MIDRAIINEYLALVDFDELDTSYQLVDIRPTDKNKFKEIENEKLE